MTSRNKKTRGKPVAPSDDNWKANLFRLEKPKKNLATPVPKKFPKTVTPQLARAKAEKSKARARRPHAPYRPSQEDDDGDDDDEELSEDDPEDAD